MSADCGHPDESRPDPKAHKRFARNLRLRQAVDAAGFDEAERATIRRFLAAVDPHRPIFGELAAVLGDTDELTPQAPRQDCSEQHRTRRTLGDLRQFANAMERIAR